jgi:hypothetical protein
MGRELQLMGRIQNSIFGLPILFTRGRDGNLSLLIAGDAGGNGGYSIIPRMANWPIFQRVGPIAGQPIRLWCSPQGDR